MPAGLTPAGICGKIEEIAAVLAEKIGKTIVIGDVQKMPVVQTRTLELSVVNFEPHGPDQVQPSAGCSTSACNVAGILRYFWFDQYNVQCCHV